MAGSLADGIQIQEQRDWHVGGQGSSPVSLVSEQNPHLRTGVGVQIRNQGTGTVKWMRQHDVCYEMAYDFEQCLRKLRGAVKSAEELNFRAPAQL